MIGVSLPFKWLISGEGALGNVDHVLSALKEHKVNSIELRTVRYHHSPSDVLRVANLLWDRGFTITVHSAARTLESALDDVFAPLSDLLINLRQERLNVTLHPIVGDNVRLLTLLADHIEDNGYPITLTLENNRRLPDKTEGDSASLVFDAVRSVNRKNVGICFDMGHYLYYRKKHYPNESVVLPDKEFFRCVKHTHIHAINEELTTHYPLGSFELPLDEMIYALYMHYYGVYNLELDVARLKDEFDILPTILDSVDYLNASMPHAARLFDEIRSDFDKKFANALTVFDKTDGCHMGLIHSTSYLFSTNGYNWAMDTAFRNAIELASSPSHVAELFSKVKLMILSHEHRDHFEEWTIKQLKDNDMKWLVPDFLYERLLSLGVPPRRVIVARNGDELSVGPLKISVFESQHFRPDTGKGVPEYGYRITSEGCPTLVFPGDIRDFSLKNFESIPASDYCFAHVWFGDNVSLNKDYGDFPNVFAKFMLHFSKKNIILAHLYENGRRDAYMWRREHALLAEKAIKIVSPDTNVLIPQSGDVLKLN